MMRTAAWLVLGALATGACTEGSAFGGDGARGSDAELAEGTRIATVATSTISSATNAAGDPLVVRVTRDVADSNGVVVIPAGSEITLTVRSIAPAPNKGEKGTLTFAVGDITINGTSHGLDAVVVDYGYDMKGTGVGTSEVAKTAAGGAAGAIIGRTVGGKKGTIPGAIGGAAAGAAIADYSQDRHIVVGSGASVTLELKGSFDG